MNKIVSTTTHREGIALERLRAGDIVRVQYGDEEQTAADITLKIKLTEEDDDPMFVLPQGIMTIKRANGSQQEEWATLFGTMYPDEKGSDRIEHDSLLVGGLIRMQYYPDDQRPYNHSSSSGLMISLVEVTRPFAA